MHKIIKYLRPFIWSIIAIFILLFGQAMADLSLPSYMSRIVNIGIQQNGIENSVPQAIRSNEMGKLTLFMTESEKNVVSADYILLDRQSLSPADYSKYVKTYPQLANSPVYKLNTGDKSRISQLDSIFSRYIPVLVTIERGGGAAFSGTPFQIPAGTDPFAVLSQLSPQQLETLRNAMSSQLSAVSSSMLTQYSAAYISGEYNALGMKVSSVQTAYMLRIGLLMLLLTIAGAAASICVGYISARIAAGLGRNLRKQIFVQVENFSNTEFDKFSTASLITRSTNDITQIQMLMVMLFRFVFYAPILGVGGIIKVIGEDRSMLWIIGAAVALMLTMIITVFTIALPKFTKVQTLMDKLNLVTREILSGQMVIRAFNTQTHEEKKFDAANQDLTKINLFINRVMVFMMPMMMLVMNGVMLLIVWVGSHQVDLGTMQVGDMMAFMQYAMQIIMSFLMLSIMFIMVPRASVSAVRIAEVLDTKPSIIDPKEPHKFSTDLKGVVEFKNVSFKYPDAEDYVLENITFTARPGQTTAFIGSTGSGKSTLVNLIPRFYDATGGKVLVDGVDVKDVTQHDLREKISYVSQKAMLFSGTIKSNIKYANENLTDEEVSKYAGTAQALDFITTSDRGFDTRVSQGGANLSGGQKQRLSIARALAKRPEIYIFDDSLSALDFKTDAALRKALRQETGNATVLIVTQRISTVMGAEQIIVLDNGRVAGTGTHKELMENCKVYNELATSQMTSEEIVS
jgi:ATP-binding cassette, subfamily B, multidrug efflux pump